MNRKAAARIDEQESPDISQEEAVKVLEQAAEAGTLTEANRRKLARILDPRRSFSGLSTVNLQQLQEDLTTLEKCQGLLTMNKAEERVISTIFDITKDDNVRRLIGYSVEELLELERTHEVTDEMMGKLRRFVEDFMLS